MWSTLECMFAFYTNCCITYIMCCMLLSLPILVFVFVSVLLAWFQFRRRINTKFDKTMRTQRQRWNCYIECSFCASVDLVIFCCLSLHAIAVRSGNFVAFFLSFKTHITQFIAYTLNGNLVVAKTYSFFLIW